MWIFADLQGSAPLIPVLFKGQLYEKTARCRSLYDLIKFALVLIFMACLFPFKMYPTVFFLCIMKILGNTAK